MTLTELRVDRNLRQEDVARLTKLTVQTISKAESGGRVASSTAMTLARFYNVRLAEIDGLIYSKRTYVKVVIESQAV